MGSNPCRKLSLLGFAHPVEGSLFQVQGVYRRTKLTRGRVLEEIQIMDLSFLCKTCIRTITFDICFG